MPRKTFKRKNTKVKKTKRSRKMRSKLRKMNGGNIVYPDGYKFIHKGIKEITYILLQDITDENVKKNSKIKYADITNIKLELMQPYNELASALLNPSY